MTDSPSSRREASITALAMLLTLALIAGACRDETARTAPTGGTGTDVRPTGATPTMDTPAARCYAVMTDAPGASGVLLFGGWDEPEAADSSWQPLWQFRLETGWSEMADAIPEPGDVFGYDTESDRAVFMDVSGETWGFDLETNTWETRQPEDAPTLHGARIIYDSESDRLIAFGGDDFSTLFDDTWAYDYETDAWTRMEPRKSPSARSFHAMAYDSGSDRVILFGGFDASGESLGDTWAYDYDGDAWTQLARGGGPEPRGYSAMAYHSRTDRTILFGGVTGALEEPLDDTWALDLETGAWERLPISGPTARGWHVMAADESSNRIVLFGGGASRAECTAETWILDPVAPTWSQAT